MVEGVVVGGAFLGILAVVRVEGREGRVETVRWKTEGKDLTIQCISMRHA